MVARLLTEDDLERSLGSGADVFDVALAQWAIDMVSAAALHITRQTWAHPEDVPPGALVVLAMAARRLYTNPDRFTRESEGDYSYSLDPSVTGAEVFTTSELHILNDFVLQPSRATGIGTLGVTRGREFYTDRYLNRYLGEEL